MIKAKLLIEEQRKTSRILGFPMTIVQGLWKRYKEKGTYKTRSSDEYYKPIYRN